MSWYIGLGDESIIVVLFCFIDVDECLTVDTNPCHSKANCINTAGTFSCECQSGYIGDGFICYGKSLLGSSTCITVQWFQV